MGVKLDEDDLRSFLEQAVRAADPDDRKRHQDRLILHLHDNEVFEVWGRALAKRYGRPHDYAEITQVVSEEVIRYVRGIEEATFEAIDRIATHLFYKAKAAVVAWLDSPAVTVAQQMSGISRRYRQSLVARNDYVSRFGREPSDAELVTYINEKAMASRKNAAKQGALVTLADVSGSMLKPYSMDYDAGDGEHDHFGAPTQDDTVRGRGELAVTVQRLGQIADDRFGEVSAPSVREVLAAWMDLVLDNEPPTVTSIAARFRLDRDSARNRMNMVDAVLTELRDGTADS